MQNFWDYSVWGFVNLMAFLLLSLLLANLLKKSIKVLRRSLIPTSVLGGLILLVVSIIYNNIYGISLFNAPIFNGKGQETLEVLTYHCLALGFIASTLRSENTKLTKERSVEIFDSGITTVSTYLIQGILGILITVVAAMLIDGFFPAAGTLLPFGYGQGTGQALNYGGIYEMDFGFEGGKSFGLTIAAMGFLSAALGGVFYLNRMKRQGKYEFTDEEIVEAINNEEIQNPDEVPMNGSIDKMSIQLAIIFGCYLLAYILIYILANLIPGFRAVLYGFNFLIGVLMAILVKKVLRFMMAKGIVNKQYINPFLMTRITGFCFDLMIVAGVAAIQMEFLAGTWPVVIILGVVGMVATYLYVNFICKKIFPQYRDEQFLVMYGMLTGTASTGMVLLREVDPEYKGPCADNLVLQQVPAMIFGFPIMFLALLAPKKPLLTVAILVVFWAVLQLILFRRTFFGKGKSKAGKTV